MSDETSIHDDREAAADAAMDRYAAGDEAAFSEVYDILAPRLYSYLRHQVQEDARAADLLQNTLIHVCRGRSSFIAGAALFPWAFAISRRLLIEDLRRGKRR